MPVFKWRMQTIDTEQQDGGMKRRRDGETCDARSRVRAKERKRGRIRTGGIRWLQTDRRTTELKGQCR